MMDHTRDRSSTLPRARRMAYSLALLSLLTACFKKIEEAPEGCTGDACGSLELRKRTPGDGCMFFFNTSSRTIALKILTSYVSYSDVYAKSEFVPKAGLSHETGTCLQSFSWGYTANFK